MNIVIISKLYYKFELFQIVKLIPNMNEVIFS